MSCCAICVVPAIIAYPCSRFLKCEDKLLPSKEMKGMVLDPMADLSFLDLAIDLFWSWASASALVLVPNTLGLWPLVISTV
eukprot:1385266-Heterocapsa_arctica.AAC.1